MWIGDELAAIDRPMRLLMDERKIYDNKLQDLEDQFKAGSLGQQDYDARKSELTSSMQDVNSRIKGREQKTLQISRYNMGQNDAAVGFDHRAATHLTRTMSGLVGLTAILSVVGIAMGAALGVGIEKLSELAALSDKARKAQAGFAAVMLSSGATIDEVARATGRLNAERGISKGTAIGIGSTSVGTQQTLGQMGEQAKLEIDALATAMYNAGVGEQGDDKEDTIAKNAAILSDVMTGDVGALDASGILSKWSVPYDGVLSDSMGTAAIGSAFFEAVSGLTSNKNVGIQAQKAAGGNMSMDWYDRAMDRASYFVAGGIGGANTYDMREALIAAGVRSDPYKHFVSGGSPIEGYPRFVPTARERSLTLSSIPNILNTLLDQYDFLSEEDRALAQTQNLVFLQAARKQLLSPDNQLEAGERLKHWEALTAIMVDQRSALMGLKEQGVQLPDNVSLTNIDKMLLDADKNYAMNSSIVNMTPYDGVSLEDLKGYASGGKVSKTELAMVGERGPEMVILPGGSEVIPNDKMGGGSVGSNIKWLGEQFSGVFDNLSLEPLGDWFEKAAKETKFGVERIINRLGDGMSRFPKTVSTNLDEASADLNNWAPMLHRAGPGDIGDHPMGPGGKYSGATLGEEKPPSAFDWAPEHILEMLFSPVSELDPGGKYGPADAETGAALNAYDARRKHLNKNYITDPSKLWGLIPKFHTRPDGAIIGGGINDEGQYEPPSIFDADPDHAWHAPKAQLPKWLSQNMPTDRDLYTPPGGLQPGLDPDVDSLTPEERFRLLGAGWGSDRQLGVPNFLGGAQDPFAGMSGRESQSVRDQYDRMWYNQMWDDELSNPVGFGRERDKPVQEGRPPIGVDPNSALWRTRVARPEMGVNPGTAMWRSGGLGIGVNVSNPQPKQPGGLVWDGDAFKSTTQEMTLGDFQKLMRQEKYHTVRDAGSGALGGDSLQKLKDVDNILKVSYTDEQKELKALDKELNEINRLYQEGRDDGRKASSYATSFYTDWREKEARALELQAIVTQQLSKQIVGEQHSLSIQEFIKQAEQVSLQQGSMGLQQDASLAAKSDVLVTQTALEASQQRISMLDTQSRMEAEAIMNNKNLSAMDKALGLELVELRAIKRAINSLELSQAAAVKLHKERSPKEVAWDMNTSASGFGSLTVTATELEAMTTGSISDRTKAAAAAGFDPDNPMGSMNAINAVLESLTTRATGGPISSRRMTLVGELGPEIVELPGGSSVIANSNLRGRSYTTSPELNGGSGGDNKVYNVTLEVGGKQLGELIIDTLNEQVRLREPGLVF